MVRLTSVVGLCVLGASWVSANPVASPFAVKRAEGQTQCGTNVCLPGYECCNASCGVCVRPGMKCTQEACTPYPQGEVCGHNVCARGYECCNASCGNCVLPGTPCTKEFCVNPDKPSNSNTPCSNTAEPDPSAHPENTDGNEKRSHKEETPCGPTTCGKGLVCCNASCGVCTKPHEHCTEELCNPDAGLKTMGKNTTEKPGGQCGRKQCASDEVCCNSSCSICTKPGGKCTMHLCLDPDMSDPEDDHHHNNNNNGHHKGYHSDGHHTDSDTDDD